jgi:hypothetical protein
MHCAVAWRREGQGLATCSVMLIRRAAETPDVLTWCGLRVSLRCEYAFGDMLKRFYCTATKDSFTTLQAKTPSESWLRLETCREYKIKLYMVPCSRRLVINYRNLFLSTCLGPPPGG